MFREALYIPSEREGFYRRYNLDKRGRSTQLLCQNSTSFSHIVSGPICNFANMLPPTLQPYNTQKEDINQKKLI
jgi:hypothetical protein